MSSTLPGSSTKHSTSTGWCLPTTSPRLSWTTCQSTPELEVSPVPVVRGRSARVHLVFADHDLLRLPGTALVLIRRAL
jgi:hypothetical protein